MASSTSSAALLLVLGLSLAARFTLLFPPTHRLAAAVAWLDLGNRLDLSSPVSAWASAMDHAYSPAHKPPLVVQLLASLEHRLLLQALFLVAVDVLAAGGLARSVQLRFARDAKQHAAEHDAIEKWRAGHRPRLDSDGPLPGPPVVEDGSTLFDAHLLQGALSPANLPWTVLALYLLSPIGILTCGARSLAPVTFCAAIWTLVFAQQRRIGLCAFALACTGYLDGPSYVAVLLGPAAACLVGVRAGGLLLFFAAAVASLGLLLGASFVLDGRSWRFIDGAYLWVLRYPDAKPNPGVWWYLFLESFQRFRAYFVVMLNSFVYHFPLPLIVHFRHRPEFAAHMGLAVLLLFQPYVELYSLSCVVVLLFAHAEFALVAPLFAGVLALAGFSVVMQPIMMYSWLEARTGNANYYYFQALIATGALCILVANTVLAAVRRDRSVARMARWAKQR
jgi:hypothetical protein